MSYEVSKKFWTGINTYPDYPHLLKRRFLDLSFILKHSGYSNSILDVGCADCSMLILLKELTPMKHFFGIDISETMMRKTSGLILKVCDVTQAIDFPETDMTISFGMFPYIFDDKDLETILKNIKSDLLLARVPCTLKERDEYINKFSTELGKNYSSVYRTKDSYVKILSNFFNLEFVERSYPDEIEGKYNTKHYYFVCRKLEN